MINLTSVQELLEQDMTRKEFLRYVGIGVLGLVGVTGVMNNIKNSVIAHKNSGSKEISGYGMSAYGR